FDILDSLDQTANPCDDFYQFACGGWRNQRTVPEGSWYTSAHSEIANDLNLKLKVLLEKELAGNEPNFIRILKEMYDSCMDVERIENESSKPLEKVLKNLGGWPVVEGEKWNSCAFDWIDTVIQLRNMGYKYNTLIDVDVVGLRNRNTYIIKLNEPSLGIGRLNLMRGTIDLSTNQYLKLMVKTANKLGANESTSERELSEALEFERKLANIDWLDFFSRLLNQEINENDPLLIMAPKFINNFANFLKEADTKAMANYMMWRVVFESLPLLSKEWRNLAVEQGFLTSESKEEPRSKKCSISFTDDTLEVPLNSYFVRHYFKDESKEAVRELVEYIHRELLNTIENITWMDQIAKIYIKEKPNSMTYNIGYPKELLNDSYISDTYANLVLDRDYFNNTLKLRKLKTDYTFSQLRKPIPKNDWVERVNVADVNAAYSKSKNKIVLPSGLLQFPLFSKAQPQYLNFGALGYYIGHEITHAFDYGVQQLDYTGKNGDWSKDIFQNKLLCLKEQYSNYVAENGKKIDGFNADFVTDNLADNGGLRLAYQAYQSWVINHGREKNLPGLPFTPNQLSWISAAK
ncbi:neprilysin-2-like, partial [Stegodyphus dumicola]|uniref:neprilysin-2-like n=1 Tax=Stegodyphus dumicola TaxID=202533 RepID=UPI0015B30396